MMFHVVYKSPRAHNVINTSSVTGTTSHRKVHINIHHS
uniref:Uncharacterized protein n=1 Tax=Arundo donax TaxID=35708 RepID=A0A0A8Z6N5_ARUDO